MSDTPKSMESQPTQSVGNPSSETDVPGAEALAALKAQVAAGVTIDSGIGDQDANQSHQGQTEGKVTVDYGGTPREVDMAELVAAHQRVGKIEDLEKVANDRHDQASKAIDFLEKMGRRDPDTMQQLASFLGEGQQQQAQDGDDFDVEFNSQTPTPNRPQEGQSSEIQYLHSQIQKLTQLAQADQNERNEKTLHSSVEEIIGGYPVFAEPVAGDFAKEAVMSDIAAARAVGHVNRQDIEQIVAKRAVGLQRVLKSQAPQAPRVGYESERIPQLTTPEKPFSADDLLSGRIGHHISAQAPGRRF